MTPTSLQPAWTPATERELVAVPLRRPSRAEAAAHPLRPTLRRRARRRLLLRSLAIADLLSLLVVFGITEVVVAAEAGGATLSRLGVYVAAGALLLGLLTAHGLYRRDDSRTDHTTTDEWPGIFHAVIAAGFIVLVTLTALGHAATVGVCVGAASAALALPVARGAARIIARRSPAYAQNTLVLGAGQVGQLVARKLVTHPEYGLRLVGFADGAPLTLDRELSAFPVLGGMDAVGGIVERLDVERVIVAFSDVDHATELDIVNELRGMDVHVDIVPRLFEAVGPSAEINVLEGLFVFSLRPMRLSRASLLAKRTLDIVVAGAGLLALGPLYGAIAVAIKLDSRGPLLYRGERIGHRGRRFGQLKFRSMNPFYATPEGRAEFHRLLQANPAMLQEFALTQKLAEDPRVTRVGRFLRRTSLDELPQLWNVVRGDLSLVGPRPITVEEKHERYGAQDLGPRAGEEPLMGYWDSAALRPGLTGYWQISGRSTMSFDERIRLDTAYLAGWSLKLDIAILIRTARVLLATRGAY